MDELWQRYRSFLTPVLIGVGVFLVGLIAVHILSDDPKVWSNRVDDKSSSVRRLVEPDAAKLRAVRQNRDTLEKDVQDWARRLDQAGLAMGADAILDVLVSDTLQAAILRGVAPDAMRAAVANPEASASQAALSRFDFDAVAAGRALANYEDVRQRRLELLRTGDANVGFVRLLSDVWAEMRVRANRADMELPDDSLGHAGVASVTRAVLAQRILNLARITQMIDLAIRSDVRAVTEVRIEQKLNPLGDDEFLREWPFWVTMRGDVASIRPILAWLTDPEHPIPITFCALTQPPRTSPLEGQVQLQVKAASVLVRPDAALSFGE